MARMAGPAPFIALSLILDEIPNPHLWECALDAAFRSMCSDHPASESGCPQLLVLQPPPPPGTPIGVIEARLRWLYGCVTSVALELGRPFAGATILLRSGEKNIPRGGEVWVGHPHMYRHPAPEAAPWPGVQQGASPGAAPPSGGPWAAGGASGGVAASGRAAPRGAATVAAESVGSVCLGGTFDHLHAGHKILLTVAAFLATDRLLCAVSDAPLLKNKKFSEELESLEVRMAQVTAFVNFVRPGLKLEVVPLQDPMGPTRVDPSLDLIVVSEETKGGVALINEARREAKLPVLQEYTIGLAAGTQPGQKLSSSVLRRLRAMQKRGSAGLLPVLIRSLTTAALCHWVNSDMKSK